MSKFRSNLFEYLKKYPRKLALPEGDDPRVREATRLLVSGGLVKEVKLFVSETKNINFSEDISSKIEMIQNPNLGGEHGALWSAGKLLAQGDVDAVVAGCVAPTAEVVRAVLKTVGLAPGIKTLSGGFLLLKAEDVGEKYLYFADSGVVIDPNEEQLVDIAKASYDFFSEIKVFLGEPKSPTIEPRIAFLSFSTKASAAHPHVTKVQNAYKSFSMRYPQIISDGELQFDAAFVPEVASRKAPNSMLKGSANIFVFPDLNSGNIAYKIAQRLGGYQAFGPLLQGAKRAYCDLSRGASSDDVFMCACINLARNI